MSRPCLSLSLYYESHDHMPYQEQINGVLPSFICEIVDIHPCSTLAGVSYQASQRRFTMSRERGLQSSGARIYL